MTLHNVNFKNGKFGKITLNYDASFQRQFNNNLNSTQKYLDNLVVQRLQRYVSKDTGTQESSIRTATICGSGQVKINVPYASYQAYSSRIHKRVGLRGTMPFERMVTDNKEAILNQVSSYSRRLNGQ